ncbi:MAG: hypothetical protein K2O78_07930 [Muribaculaceae bacterium]|nr:hypothetical protein [Muribaculaceae bacterium]
MSFIDAVKQVCDEFGKAILLESRVVAILADYGAFRSEPYNKLFYREAIASGYIKRLISTDGSVRAGSIFTFISVSGFDQDKVQAFQSAIYKCYHGKAMPKPKLSAQKASKGNKKEEIEPTVKKTSKATTTKKATVSKGKSVATKEQATAAKTNTPATTEAENKGTSTKTTKKPLRRMPLSKVCYMSVPLGSEYAAFDDALHCRGALIRKRGQDFIGFMLKDYLYGRDANILLWRDANSDAVTGITVEILTGLTIEKFRVEFTQKIVKLYERKYGDGYRSTYLSAHGDRRYVWDLGDVEISVTDCHKQTEISYIMVTDDNRESVMKRRETEEMRWLEEINKRKLQELRMQGAERLKARRLYEDL